MTNRENILAILNYQPYDRMPVVSFGYWVETLEKWAAEGHVTSEEVEGYRHFGDNSEADVSVMKKLGFDFNWSSCLGAAVSLFPAFDVEVLEEKPDGSRIIRDNAGLIVKEMPGVISIPSEIGTSLTGREAWEKLYLPRLQFCAERIPSEALRQMPKPEDREIPIGLHVGSLIGNMRNLLGVQELSYLYMDDEELYEEIVNTLCGLCYDCTKAILETGAQFDYAHFWEDICYKNGPLVTPHVFEELIGPHYKKICDLLKQYGVQLVSVDCDGCIDTLVPTWLKNGVNIMFPIEVGTWNASIEPWRNLYGKELRGVGGMNKTVFAKDRAAVDAEVERLKKLVALGGYIPCPDHRIPPDAKFELVQYYCQKMAE